MIRFLDLYTHIFFLLNINSPAVYAVRALRWSRAKAVHVDSDNYTLDAFEKTLIPFSRLVLVLTLGG